MSQQSTEENKTEEASPYKLRKARERGQVARGVDLGFFSILLASLLLIVIFGNRLGQLLMDSMAKGLMTIPTASGEVNLLPPLVAWLSVPAVETVLLAGVLAAVVVICLEIVQLRGVLFSTQPLKPDFSRLNPLMGLKRLFSVRTLKETFKSIVKMGMYAGFGGLAILIVISAGQLQIANGFELARAMRDGLLTLLAVFAVIALLVMALDQVIARGEFAKEMRMSRSELQREHKENEGEPRLKQRRKRVHAEYAKQTKALAGLPGADILLVNPEHVAVALAYDPSRMEAPEVAAVGRNHFAAILRTRAFELGIPVVSDPPLARALHASTEPGQTIGQEYFMKVARHYLRLRELMAGRENTDA